MGGQLPLIVLPTPGPLSSESRASLRLRPAAHRRLTADNGPLTMNRLSPLLI